MEFVRMFIQEVNRIEAFFLWKLTEYTKEFLELRQQYKKRHGGEDEERHVFESTVLSNSDIGE